MKPSGKSDHRTSRNEVATPSSRNTLDADVLDLLTGVIENSFASSLEQLSTSKHFLGNRLEQAQMAARGNPRSISTLQKGTVILGGIDNVLRSTHPGRLRSLLSSPEVATIVRQIYTARLAEKRDDYLEAIKQQFCQHFALQFGERNSNRFAGQFFSVLLDCSDAVVSAALETILSQ